MRWRGCSTATGRRGTPCVSATTVCASWHGDRTMYVWHSSCVLCWMWCLSYFRCHMLDVMSVILHVWMCTYVILYVSCAGCVCLSFLVCHMFDVMSVLLRVWMWMSVMFGVSYVGCVRLSYLMTCLMEVSSTSCRTSNVPQPTGSRPSLLARFLPRGVPWSEFTKLIRINSGLVGISSGLVGISSGHEQGKITHVKLVMIAEIVLSTVSSWLACNFELIIALIPQAHKKPSRKKNNLIWRRLSPYKHWQIINCTYNQ